MKRTMIRGVAAAHLALANPCLADVIDTREDGFTVESSVVVQAASDPAYMTLTKAIGAWWDSAHTWSGSAQNLSLDARAGGCFCEQLPASGGSVQHGQVIFALPGKLLRLDAALGPFQEMPVNGVLTFRITAEGNTSRVTVNYRVSGTLSMDSAKLATGADGMLAGQMQRFKLFIETGKPAK